MTPPGNMAASVKARLQNVARKRGEEFNLILNRYAIERLLYRLSTSTHADTFLLKGAILFAVWDDSAHRPTRDLDLLGFGPNEKDDLIRIFSDIIQTTVPEDGVSFDPQSVVAEEIREDKVYGGIRIRVIARLGKARLPIQIDVGYGDAVTPDPESIDFPVLLDFPVPRLKAYPVYTVIAEKLEAAVKLKSTNTRMKDFYDLWFLAQRFEFDGPTLREAIEATFKRRSTPLPVAPEPFSSSLFNDSTKQTQWAGFIRRNLLMDAPSRFPDVVSQIGNFIDPVLHHQSAPANWHPETGWHLASS